jgi:hypothetical protein
VPAIVPAAPAVPAIVPAVPAIVPALPAAVPALVPAPPLSSSSSSPPHAINNVAAIIATPSRAHRRLVIRAPLRWLDVMGSSMRAPIAFERVRTRELLPEVASKRESLLDCVHGVTE